MLVPAAKLAGLAGVFPFKSKKAKLTSKASIDVFGMAVHEPGEPEYMVLGVSGEGAA